jgi:CBS domain-containing protein
MKIVEIMTANPEFVTPDDSVIDVANIMARENVGLVPVCESRETRKLCGVITDRDIVVRVIAEGKDPRAIASLTEIMSPELVTCSPDDDVDTVKQLMQDHQVRRVLGTDEHGCLVGLVAQADLARELAREEVGETLKAISQETPSPTI